MAAYCAAAVSDDRSLLPLSTSAADQPLYERVRNRTVEDDVGAMDRIVDYTLVECFRVDAASGRPAGAVCGERQKRRTSSPIFKISSRSCASARTTGAGLR